MLKKLVSLLVLSCLSFSVFASEPTGAVQPIRDIMAELREEQQKSAEYIQSLETNNEQIKSDLIESINSQQEQTRLLENYGNLIDEQAIYYRSLNRKLIFWRTTSIVFSVSLLATVGIVLATQPWK